MQVRASALLRLVVAAACAAVLVAACAGCGDQERHGTCGKAFDRDAWGSGLVGHPSRRQRVADHVIACRSLDGRRRSDVRRLLGKPDFPSRPSRYYYELGGGRSAGPLDNEFLSIRFDGRARVAAVEIVGF